jgi:hypothetical protein
MVPISMVPAWLYKDITLQVVMHFHAIIHIFFAG